MVDVAPHRIALVTEREGERESGYWCFQRRRSLYYIYSFSTLLETARIYCFINRVCIYVNISLADRYICINLVLEIFHLVWKIILIYRLNAYYSVASSFFNFNRLNVHIYVLMNTASRYMKIYRIFYYYSYYTLCCIMNIIG